MSILGWAFRANGGGARDSQRPGARASTWTTPSRRPGSGIPLPRGGAATTRCVPADMPAQSSSSRARKHRMAPPDRDGRAWAPRHRHPDQAVVRPRTAASRRHACAVIVVTSQEHRMAPPDRDGGAWAPGDRRSEPTVVGPGFAAPPQGCRRRHRRHAPNPPHGPTRPRRPGTGILIQPSAPDRGLPRAGVSSQTSRHPLSHDRIPGFGSTNHMPMPPNSPAWTRRSQMGIVNPGAGRGGREIASSTGTAQTSARGVT